MLASALDAELQKFVASGFRDTITENAKDDPAAFGWRRFARHGACKFCLMLAERGAVYRRATANFAAHTHCHCVAGPSYDPNAPRASALQYVASGKRSSDPLVQMARNAAGPRVPEHQLSRRARLSRAHYSPQSRGDALRRR
jgi:hypothetical protein